MPEFLINPNCTVNFCFRPERVFFHFPEHVNFNPRISFLNFCNTRFTTKSVAALKLKRNNGFLIASPLLNWEAKNAVKIFGCKTLLDNNEYLELKNRSQNWKLYLLRVKKILRSFSTITDFRRAIKDIEWEEWTGNKLFSKNCFCHNLEKISTDRADEIILKLLGIILKL
jgi:hypothetical protein